MEFWQLASLVCGGLISLLALNFGVFWRILQDVKADLKKDINVVKDDAVSALNHAKNNLSQRIEHSHNESLEIYKYVDETFARKDTHSIEYGHILEKVKNIDEKLDIFYKEFKGIK